MPSTKINRLTGITSPHQAILNALGRNPVDPSPVPLLRARIDLATAPRHIEACLRNTLESLDVDLITAVTNKLRVSDLQEVQKQLLIPITQTWSPSGSGMWTISEGTGVPRNLPQAVQEFRLQLKRLDIPVTDEMEVALTEALWSAMNVLQADNDILVQIAKAFDNNPNYRHEVGRLVGIRDVALSGEFRVR